MTLKRARELKGKRDAVSYATHVGKILEISPGHKTYGVYVPHLIGVRFGADKNLIWTHPRHLKEASK